MFYAVGGAESGYDGQAFVCKGSGKIKAPEFLSQQDFGSGSIFFPSL